MSVIKELDREADSDYSLVIVASNNCENPPTSLDDIKAESKLDLQIMVIYFWKFLLLLKYMKEYLEQDHKHK